MSQTYVILHGTDAAVRPRLSMEGERIPISLEDAIAGWLLDIVLSGGSPHTVRGYRSKTRVLTGPDGRIRTSDTSGYSRLPHHSGSSGLLSVTDLTPTLIRSLMAAQINRGIALSTCRSFYVACCSLSNWCVLAGHLAVSPMREIPCPKPPERPHRYLSVDELRRLWDAAGSSRRTPDEARLILLLLMEGLRANELCSLRWRDVKDDRIIVAYGKGGKVRAIPLSDGVRELLEKRMAERVGFEPTDPKATPLAGARIKPDYATSPRGGPPEIRTQTSTAFETAPSAVGVEAHDALEALSGGSHSPAGFAGHEPAALPETLPFLRLTLQDGDLTPATPTNSAPVAPTVYMAEAEGFEPPSPLRLTVFKTAAHTNVSASKTAKNTTQRPLEGRQRAEGRIFAMSPSSLYHRIQHLGTRAKVPHVHPHLLRHTAASLLFRAGIDSTSMCELFGWVPGSAMLVRYTKSIQQDAALARARDVGLAKRLFED